MDEISEESRNQVRLRTINERYVAAMLDFRADGTTPSGGVTGDGHTEPELTLLCECSLSICTTMLVLTLDDYRSARGFASACIVAPNHHSRSRERVISQQERYWLVEMLPES